VNSRPDVKCQQFYITNHTEYSAEQVVALANQRCDQENVIEQLKNGVNAMRMPVDDLLGVSADGVPVVFTRYCAIAGSDCTQLGLVLHTFSLGLDLPARTDRLRKAHSKAKHLGGSEDAILVGCRLQERLALVLVRTISIAIRNSNICE
jgi:hypothetical protein